MADTKITALAAITTIDTANDVLPIVDVDDHSMAASGTTKRVTTNQLLGAGGTATLASATISGNATAAAFIPSGSSIPSNGIYLPSANNVGFAYNSTLGMTLNSTGLGIGATPISRLHSSNGSSSDSGLFTGLTIGGTGASSARTASFIKNTSSPYDLIIRTQDFTSGTSGSFIVQNGSTEQFRIDSSGNVGIGVTPSAWGGSFKAFQIGSVNSLAAFSQNLYLSANWYNGAGDKYIANGLASQYAQSNGTHAWFTASNNTLGAGAACTFTQAMTLDASGRLLVGTANASVTSETGCRLLLNNGAVGHFTLAVTTNQSTAATSCYDFYSTSAAAYRFYVTSAGVINATNTTISAISDARLKENVQDIDVGLGAILALKPRKFDWKAGKGKDIKGDRGFIAQEFEQVFPQLVDEWKDAAPEGEAPYKSVRQDLIPVLVKAIQELAAEVNALKNA